MGRSKYSTKRHKDLQKKLSALGFKRLHPTKDNERIAKILGVTSITVFNYTNGAIADPYLGEDILRELKNSTK